MAQAQLDSTGFKLSEGHPLLIDPEPGDPLGPFDPMGYLSDGESSSSSSDLDDVVLPPRIGFRHHLGGSVQENVVSIHGTGVTTLYGEVRVAQTTWKVLIKHGVFPDYLHSISHFGELLKFEFLVPGHRTPVTIKFKYHTRPELKCLFLGQGVP